MAESADNAVMPGLKTGFKRSGAEANRAAWGVFVMGVVLAWAGVGCGSLAHFRPKAMVPSYVPSNVYAEEPVLPRDLKRVAVLPLIPGDSTGEMEFGRETLEPILTGELFRRRQFEVELVSSERLLQITGLSRWDGQGRFPEDFFDRLREALGVQAVLVTELTRYRPHEPLVIGWRLKLIDATEPRVLWAVDEVFDARDPSVAAGARRFADSQPESVASLSDERAVLQSPRRFGRYSACAVVATLPARASSAPALKN